MWNINQKWKLVNFTCEPPLKAKNPNMRMNAPRAARGTECPLKSTWTSFFPGWNLPMRGPRKAVPTKAAVPPNRWTTPLPAKSRYAMFTVWLLCVISNPCPNHPSELHAQCVTTGYTKPSSEYIGNVMAHFSGICYWLHSFLQHALYFAPRAVIFSHLKRMPLCLRVCDIAIVMCRKVVRTYLSSFDFCAALKDF